MSDENVGRVLAHKYELVRLLGRGGMGAVYEGKNQIGKRVAIKVLVEPELVRNLDLIARFFREAQAAASVESTHVVDVYDTGVDGETGFPFIIMAYLSGEDLEQLIRRVGALNPVAAVRIASQAAAGLAKAHDAGIVHRDVKPANLFLATDEGESVVKILDFGIAKLSVDRELSGNGGAGAGPLTQSGAVLGTPLYMSPEQAQGLKTIDARTDVWSLGMCLYQALAGRLPFNDIDTLGKVIVAIVTHEVPPLCDLAPWVRPELAAVVHQALERDVEKRIPSARQFMAAVSPFLSGTVALTPEILVGVRETLGATLSVVPGAPSSRDVLNGPLSSQDTLPLHAAATTAGVSSARIPAATPKRRASGKAIALAFGGLAAVTAGVFALARSGTKEGTETAATASPSNEPPSPASASPASSAPAVAPDAPKVGVLTVKAPEGYTVKVDGQSPGGPESHAAARTLEDGKLELRGEFQTKFLVAVFDKAGKRLMVQDVYLYDNKLDPEAIDTTVGQVNVEKPKRKAASALPARF
jgi:serine/threonine protein kinase